MNQEETLSESTQHILLLPHSELLSTIEGISLAEAEVSLILQSECYLHCPLISIILFIYLYQFSHAHKFSQINPNHLGNFPS